MLEDGWTLQKSWQVNPFCPSNFPREEHMDMVILDVGGDRSHLHFFSPSSSGSLQ